MPVLCRDTAAAAAAAAAAVKDLEELMLRLPLGHLEAASGWGWQQRVPRIWEQLRGKRLLSCMVHAYLRSEEG